MLHFITLSIIIYNIAKKIEDKKVYYLLDIFNLTYPKIQTWIII